MSGGGDGRASLPKAARYVAIQGQYNLMPAAGSLMESDVGVLITYGEFGTPIPDFLNRIAFCTTVRDWIANHKVYVIHGMDFN